MSTGKPPPGAIPTLTDVVAWSGPGPTVPQAAPALESDGELQATPRALADLQRQVDLMLEVRLREALAPILSRAADTVVREARKELTAVMREIVERSIADAPGRRKER